MSGQPGAWGEADRLVLIEDISREAELERQKEDWRSMAAHDLRAPLTSIIAVLNALKELPEGAALDAQLKATVDVGLQASRRMSDLINTYLDLAKLDAGLMPVKSREIDLKAALGQCVEEQKPLAAGKKINVSLQGPQGLKIKADPGLLSRVLENVLNNAIKYSAEGKRVEITFKPAGSDAAIEFKDNGPGIRKEDLPRIFDRYYQAQVRRAGRILGTGLGLAFCHEALKAMSGSISAVSKPGKGSSFILRLPLQKTAKA